MSIGAIDAGAAWPAELVQLLGGGAGEALAAAVGAAGGSLVSWTPRQVHHRPGRSTQVQYRVEARRTDGTVGAETVVATAGPDVAVWRWDRDPALPGLAIALDRDRAAALLGDLGLGHGPPRLRARSYRPGRRAVVEVTGPRGRLFLKVVPPARAEALHGIHRRLAAALPVPDSLGWSAEGIVVLGALPGERLRDVLRDGRPPLPPPDALAALLDRLPADLADGRDGHRPRDVLAGAAHYASVIASVQPEARGRLDDILSALAARGARVEHAVVPVHGDFYDAQVLVREGAIAGLVDVDTAGAGHRVDDLATLLGHLSVLGSIPDHAEPVNRYAAEVLAAVAPRFDAADLHARIAAVVLSLATGPFRVLDPRWRERTLRLLDHALGWLGDA